MNSDLPGGVRMDETLKAMQLAFPFVEWELDVDEFRGQLGKIQILVCSHVHGEFMAQAILHPTIASDYYLHFTVYRTGPSYVLAMTKIMDVIREVGLYRPDVGEIQDLVSKAMLQCWTLGQQYWRECEAEVHGAICQPEDTQQQYFQLVDEVRAQIAKELGDGRTS